ncbi:DUF7576 family protein [Halosimplex marinum]|uniref:DUF7576 family protein n=1 Tax=Halosimplex marinum TaxID=3396620 RepID=UPI003F55086C
MASHAEEGPFETCAHCGARLSGQRWFPATTRVEGGSVSVVSFCDDGCLTAWRER